MPLYRAPASDVQPSVAPGGVACRCCPGQISRSTRTHRYPSDMTEAEWSCVQQGGVLPGPVMGVA